TSRDGGGAARSVRGAHPDDRHARLGYCPDPSRGGVHHLQDEPSMRAPRGESQCSPDPRSCGTQCASRPPPVVGRPAALAASSEPFGGCASLTPAPVTRARDATSARGSRACNRRVAPIPPALSLGYAAVVHASYP